MQQQYSRHTAPATAACNKIACKDKLFCREKGVFFIQKASIFVKTNEKETKVGKNLAKRTRRIYRKTKSPDIASRPLKFLNVSAVCVFYVVMIYSFLKINFFIWVQN